MNPSIRTSFLIPFILIVFVLSACISEADASKENNTRAINPFNNPPTAHISAPSNINLNTPVTASAQNSLDPEGNPLSYRWQLIAPANSKASLFNMTSVNALFIPDVPGTYLLTLNVNDGQLDGKAQHDMWVKTKLIKQSFTLQNTVSDTQNNMPFTFATVFTPKAYADDQRFNLQLASGDILSLQTDIKATHKDGSLRHAIFSGILPSLISNETIDAQLIPASNKSNVSATHLNELINSGWDVGITLTINGVRYTASAAELLNTQSEKKWLDGHIVNEWLVDGPVKTVDGNEHPALSARFNIRVYGNLEHIRASVIVENNWAYQPSIKNITYDASINMDGKIVFDETALVHLKNARWKKDFWHGSQPNIHIAHDAAYLMASGALPNYDANLINNIKPSLISQYSDRWINQQVEREMGDNGYPVPPGSGGTPFIYNKIGPMGIGFADAAMPNTGSRPDIGPLPRWGAAYLLSQNATAKKVALGMGDLAGSWPIHYRHKATGQVVSIDQFPYATRHEDRTLSKNPNTGNFEQVTQCNSSTPADCLSPYRPDTAHQPSLVFVPYLVSGDHYYMEELMFWANYNFLTLNPSYRGTDQGWFERAMQDRAQAWSMRTLAQTAYITPDAHPMKPYFESKLQSNLSKYDNKYLLNKPNNYGSLIPNYSYPTHSPWMDDFFTWAIGYVNGLGYVEAKPLLDWKSKFSINRMGFGSQDAQSYCWIFGASYHLLIAPSKNAPMFQDISEVYNNTNGQDIPYGGAFDDKGEACATRAQADAIGLRVGEMTGYSASPTGFPSNMQIALAAAATSGIQGSEDAWQRFMARSVKPDYTGYPNFAIVPRTPAANTGK